MALQFQPGQLAGILYPQPQNNLTQPMPPAPPEAKKPGAFGKGGDAWKIMGIIGDALQTAAGGQATYAPAIMSLQEQIAKENQFQQRLQAQAEQRRLEREQGLQDQKALIDYRNTNPTPDSFQKALLAAGIDPNSDEARNLARKRAEMLTNPVQLVPDGMGGYQAVRPNESGGGLPQGYDPSEWELVPGDAGGNASGGF